MHAEVVSLRFGLSRLQPDEYGWVPQKTIDDSNLCNYARAVFADSEEPSLPEFCNRPLGELEMAVMEVLWRHAPASVKDVSHALPERNLAYTTLMTTLDRLHKKRLLDREKQGHAFLYRPSMDRASYERRLVAGLLGDLPMASREALLSGFLDYAATDEASLDALERLIAARKRGES